MKTKADNDFTTFFADKTGDKMYIEVEITGDPNEVTKTLYKSFQDDKDFIEGAKVTKILFKGNHPEGEIENALDNVLSEFQNKLVGTVIDIRSQIKNDEPIKINKKTWD